MAFLPGYINALTHFDRERYEQKIDECGCDPYECVWDSLSEETKDWPAVTEVDRMQYLVFTTNFVTKEQMKNYKSLEAHNFLTSGHVFRPRSQILTGDRVLLLGKVSSVPVMVTMVVTLRFSLC